MKLDIILAFITTSFLKMERRSPDFQSLEPIAPVSMATWTTPQTPTDGQPVPWRTLQPTTINVYTIRRNSALRNVRNAHDNISLSLAKWWRNTSAIKSIFKILGTVSKFDVSNLGIATTPAPRTTTNSPKTTFSVETTTKLTTSEPQTATTSAGSTWTTSFAEETSIVTTTYSSTSITSSTTSDMHCIDASKNCVTNHLCWMRWYSDGCLKHCNLC